jgi:hypothetical protein
MSEVMELLLPSKVQSTQTWEQNDFKGGVAIAQLRLHAQLHFSISGAPQPQRLVQGVLYPAKWWECGYP